jgi:hypothetical protein
VHNWCSKHNKEKQQERQTTTNINQIQLFTNKRIDHAIMLIMGMLSLM